LFLVSRNVFNDFNLGHVCFSLSCENELRENSWWCICCSNF